MKRSGIAVGVVAGSVLLGLVVMWGCASCATKMAPAERRTAQGTGDEGGARPAAAKKPYNWRAPGRDPMEADRPDATAAPHVRPEMPAPDTGRTETARGQKDAISDVYLGGADKNGAKTVSGSLTEGGDKPLTRKEAEEELGRLMAPQNANRLQDRATLEKRIAEAKARIDQASRKDPTVLGRKRTQVLQNAVRRYCEAGRVATKRVAGVRSWQSDLATDELWVIERPGKGSNQQAADPDAPSQGELRAKVKDDTGKDTEVPLPLEHTDVKASVAAFVATVDVTQKYRNPYDTKIEAVYVFPLPQNAAVTDFIMTIGERRIRGIIRERTEARKIYEQAKRQGRVASLLTQERPNIFTQRVANIEPKKAIGITIRYFNTLTYSKGNYEFVFPMVVGPRYNPPGWKDGIGAVAKGKGGSSGQPVEVQYLKPGERSGHDISLTLDVDAGVAIEDVKCHSHAIKMERPGPSRVRVSLSRLDTIPNKDFVLRYKVAGRRMKTAFLTNASDKGSHFALVLQPPEELADLPRMPREMVFVLDCSGSMRGRPMQKAKEAMRRCLRKLAPDDTFQVIRFSSNASALGNAPVAATPANVRRGLKYIEGLRGTGGTRMIEGIKAALDFPHDRKRLRVVSFMTDGYIGNESQILAAIHDKLGAARIFSFGVGNSVNRYLLDSMARMGKGAVAYVGLQEGAIDAVDLFYDRCSRPAMTDIEIDWGGMKVDSVYPRNIPDLFVGRPVIVTGRYQGSGSNSIRVSGRSGREDRSFMMSVDLDAPESRHAGITKVWARKKLAELAAHMTHEPSKELQDEMTELSLEYSVQCRYTAFLAVDSSRVTEGGVGVTVAVPVPVPDGVRYDTTVGGE